MHRNIGIVEVINMFILQAAGLEPGWASEAPGHRQLREVEFLVILFHKTVSKVQKNSASQNCSNRHEQFTFFVFCLWINLKEI